MRGAQRVRILLVELYAPKARHEVKEVKELKKLKKTFWESPSLTSRLVFVVSGSLNWNIFVSEGCVA